MQVFLLLFSITINQGDIVTWVNDGGFHNVNFTTNSITNEPYNNPESFDSPSNNEVGAVIYTHTFNIPGEYTYDCSVGSHAQNGMVGQITVLPTADCNDSNTTVVDVIVNSEDHNTLETAIINSGLVDVLDGEGPFTIFAPTDNAFNALAEGAIDILFTDTELLISVLTHHIAQGSILSSNLADGMIVTTNGTDLMVTFTYEDGGVMIDNAIITISDIITDNGIVHVIDAVLPEQINYDNNELDYYGCIFSDDFSDSSTWVIDHDQNACNLDWEIGTGLSAGGSYPISTIESTTAGNGFAMIDSDEYGGEEGGTEIEDSWFTTAQPINLSDFPNVVLQFETWYRSWTYEKCWVVTSTDGVTWPELTPDSQEDTANGIYEVFPGISGDGGAGLSENPFTKTINISESAGGQEQVWIRFHWTGTWGYTWFVDDVCVLVQNQNDLQMVSAKFSSTDPNGSYYHRGAEYGRLLANQIPVNLSLILKF